MLQIARWDKAALVAEIGGNGEGEFVDTSALDALSQMQITFRLAWPKLNPSTRDGAWSRKEGIFESNIDPRANPPVWVRTAQADDGSSSVHE